jgi:uncharacterized protein
MVVQDVSQKPVPIQTAMSEPFWSATKDGRLLIQRCSTCRQFWWLPQGACRDCYTETLEWTQVSGRAVVYSYVTMYRSASPAFTAPYTVAVVTLEEGPLFMTTLVGIEPDDVAIGMPVHVAFEDVGPVALPLFGPRKDDLDDQQVSTSAFVGEEA